MLGHLKSALDDTTTTEKPGGYLQKVQEVTASCISACIDET